MTETLAAPAEANLPADDGTAPQALTLPEKAAVIIGVLGVENAGPILERFDEVTLRAFATAMSKLRKIDPRLVEQTIREFLGALEEADMTVTGGLNNARAILQDYVADATLSRIMDDVDTPSAQNVWQKLSRVDDQSLADFLMAEHPQVAAVVLSKLPAERAASILGRGDEGRARDIIVGMTRTPHLNAEVIAAIGESVSRDFLENYRGGGTSVKPEDRIGTIMTYTSGDVRQSVLNYLDEAKPDLAEAVKSRMFTFADLPDRLQRRDVTTVLRAVDAQQMLKAVASAEELAPRTYEFIMSGISSRFADQLKADLEDVGKVKIREAEDAQNAILRTVRALESAGEIQLVQPE